MAGGVVVLVIVLSKCGCKICKNHELAGAALVVGIVARATLVDFIAVGPVF